MKKFIYILLATVAFTACNSDEPAPINKGKLDPNAFIRIEAQKGVKSRSAESTDDYSALDIAKYGATMQFTSEWDTQAGQASEKVKEYQSQKGFMMQRDTISENPALLMFGTDIITSSGHLLKDFLYAHNVVITGIRYKGRLTTYNDQMAVDPNDDPKNSLAYAISKEGVLDTIAYLPNSIMREAQDKIERAFNDSNYTEVYKLFHETFKFKPITGAKWRELKAKGLN